MSFQDIDHSLVPLSQTVHAFSFFSPSFVVRLALCYLCFLCVSSSLYLRNEGFCGTTGWVYIVIIFFTFSKAAMFRVTILQRKGRCMEMLQTVYIKEFKWSCSCGWKHFGVFSDWMWPCSSSQCSRRQTLINFDRVGNFLFSFLHLFLFPVPLIFVCSSVCQLWLCCIPRCFSLV